MSRRGAEYDEREGVKYMRQEEAERVKNATRREHGDLPGHLLAVDERHRGLRWGALRVAAVR